MLKTEPCAGTAETSLHFIRDQHDAMLFGQRPQCLEKFGRCGKKATVALNRLNDDCGYPLGRYLRGKQIIQCLQRHFAGEAAISIRIRSMKDLGCHTEILLVRLAHTRQGRAEQRPAMETTTKGNNSGTLGMSAGNLDGVLHGFRT
ncbi:hypothetical protein D3C76_756270 [compost metagenome]